MYQVMIEIVKADDKWNLSVYESRSIGCIRNHSFLNEFPNLEQLQAYLLESCEKWSETIEVLLYDDEGVYYGDEIMNEIYLKQNKAI